jgi:hypothetical protein
MRSSTSSSEAGEHQFARVVPPRAWSRIICIATLLFAMAVGAWEIQMRRAGLTTEDLGDGRAYWAVERRKVDAGPPDSVVIIGDSRILFDTDLDIWQQLTSYRPIQLALPGQNAQPVLHDLAQDERFRGLVVMGTAEMSYFADDAGSEPIVLKYLNAESPSQRVGHQIYVLLSRYFAFLDDDSSMFRLLEQRRWPERPGVVGPYDGVWKISESSTARQTWLWERIAQNGYLRDHARRVWLEEFAGRAPTKSEVDSVVERTRADMDRIRARGGEVVWIRPPSAGPLFASEQVRFPRQQVWDRLVHETGSFGVHFEDYGFAQDLWLPDWSHLHKADRPAFTAGYIHVLAEHTAWLSSRLQRAGRPELFESHGRGKLRVVAQQSPSLE